MNYLDIIILLVYHLFLFFRFLFNNTYKDKMSSILQAAPDISLYKDEDLPPDLREVAILTGYRSPSSSVKECALSIFVATNETLNFWTHFIPTFYFVYQLTSFWSILKVVSDSYYWPFIVYMISICLYPLISALAHIFCTTSHMARHVWFFIDYGGLSWYAYGAGLLIKAYSFPVDVQDAFMGKYFMEVLVFLVICCSVSACYSRFLDNLFWIKVFRLGAFFLPWVWDNIPVIYRLNFNSDMDSATSEHYKLQFFWSFCIGFFYSSHLPEILAPGKFDFVGNSHQLLHISGILATHHQMSAAILDMKYRKELMQSKYAVPDYWSLHISGLVFFSIIVTIIIFILWAKHYEKNKQQIKRDN